MVQPERVWDEAQGLEPRREFEATRIIPSRIICDILP